MRKPTFVLLLSAGIALASLSTRADEGMWTFDNLPLQQLKDRYGFTPAQAWVDHLRLSSVRFNDGGSGSFVSADGLVLTNHHVALGQLQKLSTPQVDYAKDVFYAPTRDRELKCPDLELNVLVSMEDVTARVRDAVKPGMTGGQAVSARTAEIASIQKASLDATGLRSDVVALYGGGEYWLYRYKKYTDVRVVFAPEQQIAFYGGDPDNFTYPRYDLDFALFRVYENGQPVKSANYLHWNRKGADAGDLVFVSGHPGTTERDSTVTELELDRDLVYPALVGILERRVATLKAFAARGPEPAREAAATLFSLENSLKAYNGMSKGLADPALFAKKRDEEQRLRTVVAGRADLRSDIGDPWATAAQASARERDLYLRARYQSLTNVGPRLATLANTIVRYVAEVRKPDGERLDGYHEADLESLRVQVLSPAPVYPDLDEVLLRAVLQDARDQLGAADPFVAAVLGARSPAEVAASAVSGTRLGDPAVRRALLDGGEAAVSASADPLIVLARAADPFYRANRKALDEGVDALLVDAKERLSKARFAVYGKTAYPDATFTLRLAFGTVKGYPMNGTEAPPKTTLFGLYDRAASFDDKPPFDLPARYVERRDRLDMTTPLNFVSTADIIGGNSGSPVVNRAGEIVGLIFDGNIESLVGRFEYLEETNRAVAVETPAIGEALRKIYDASALADELER